MPIVVQTISIKLNKYIQNEMPTAVIIVVIADAATDALHWALGEK